MSYLKIWDLILWSEVAGLAMMIMGVGTSLMMLTSTQGS